MNDSSLRREVRNGNIARVRQSPEGCLSSSYHVTRRIPAETTMAIL